MGQYDNPDRGNKKESVSVSQEKVMGASSSYTDGKNTSGGSVMGEGDYKAKSVTNEQKDVKYSYESNFKDSMSGGK